MDYLCEPLSKRHDRKSFDCGVEALNMYLAKHASQDIRRKAAAVFVIVPAGEQAKVAGFFTLCSTSIELSDLPADLTKRLPRYPEVPAILIGRLARDRHFPGVGSLLLVEALIRCVQAAQTVAATVIVVDAKDEAAAVFYQKFGFLRLPRLSSKLFLPMATAEQI